MKIFLVGLLFIFMLILFLTVKIEIIYSSLLRPKFNISLKILFFKINFNNSSNHNNINKHGKSKKIKKSLKQKVSKSSKKNSEKKSNKFTIKFKDINLENLNEYYQLLKKCYDCLSSVIKHILKHIAIENIEFLSVVAKDDAAETGIAYGKYNIIICNLYSLLIKIFNIKKSKIYIYPNFVNNKPETYLNLKIKFKPAILLFILVAIFFKYGIIIYRKFKNLKINKAV